MTLTAITTTPDGNTTRATWTVTEQVRAGEHLRHAIGAAVEVSRCRRRWACGSPMTAGRGGAGYNPVATAIAATYGHGHPRHFPAVVPAGGPDPHGIAAPLSATASAHLLAAAQAALATYAGQRAPASA